MNVMKRSFKLDSQISFYTDELKLIEKDQILIPFGTLRDGLFS